MSALDPVVSARPTYLPTGPREEYRGDRPAYRRDEGPRGGCTPARGSAAVVVRASIPAQPAKTVVTTDQMSAEKLEPVADPSVELSTSQKDFAMQPTISRLRNPALRSPFLTGPIMPAGESPQDNKNPRSKLRGIPPLP
ncbi:hypothetical protein JKG47_20225 [Acidithiobacillus sp. MC6.1]|nr:hypothetical protein [Acidithiobacillus sp. MC6.1]